MENSPSRGIFAGKKKKKDNTHPASKLAFGAKFQVTGDVRGGEQEPRDWGAGGR